MSSLARLRMELDRELHDLCQPLTTASCHLELGQMLGDAESLKTAVDGALEECRRTYEYVRRMRAHLAELLKDAN